MLCPLCNKLVERCASCGGLLDEGFSCNYESHECINCFKIREKEKNMKLIEEGKETFVFFKKRD